MEAKREIIIPTSNKIVITIPDHFVGKEIEVLVFEIEEKVHQEEKTKSPFIVANIKVEKYKFNRDEANER